MISSIKHATAKLSLLSLLTILTFTSHAQPTELPGPVRVVVDGHQFPSDAYALLVQEIGSDTPLLSVNAELPLNPASTIKTLTTLAALDILGPTYTWRTELYALGAISDGTLNGDLLLRGGGDPFLVEEHFRSMLKTLQRRGVQHISGDLLIDASLYHPSVSQEESLDAQSNRAYNVLPHAAITNFQAVTFYFYPAANGRDVRVKADPPLPGLNIDNRLRLQAGACTGFQRGISFSEDRSNQTVIFSGTFPSRCDEYAMTRAVMDAPTYTYELFRQLWAELGGTLAGSYRLSELPSTESPPAAEPLVVWQSPPLGDVVTSINKYSNNTMTRQLLLTLGLHHSAPPGTVDKGIAAINDYLDKLQIDRSTLSIANGSGLSRDTRLSARLLADLMLHAWQQPIMPEFIASLPLAGLDGTMRDRLSDESATGRIHVKTGSLNGVAGVTGYVLGASGKRYVVAALVNHPGADRGTGQELGDALLRWAGQQ
ncbi:D-alanyl-D-alanine carboxypeptidase/D-alanyl-D-alanine-endopeptidase [Pseudohongiella sp. SYSU M77423]|uniref:D-alanyl-D-alanine carboxypeptidase/D-alanyl-D-alanine endopeptidase n=1 Tax=Pseudohongiella sp. SYSU M77423 TaxID=3042312 RepID=UPI002480FCC1|nr:D-alanyl-D-alanine carboxypeptidase/D-alanyl-D-alanine-endopeptidase [Pseudohongiella sp. SYSU M77423]MDH7944829.1 D-alanyl-D-alanine carboxypeptidase/D-alanyl-D-alanine-endopeptidase [Pseudohongiella sp. SYSU M77423]